MNVGSEKQSILQNSSPTQILPYYKARGGLFDAYKIRDVFGYWIDTYGMTFTPANNEGIKTRNNKNNDIGVSVAFPGQKQEIVPHKTEFKSILPGIILNGKEYYICTKGASSELIAFCIGEMSKSLDGDALDRWKSRGSSGNYDFGKMKGIPIQSEVYLVFIEKDWYDSLTIDAKVGDICKRGEQYYRVELFDPSKHQDGGMGKNLGIKRYRLRHSGGIACLVPISQRPSRAPVINLDYFDNGTHSTKVVIVSDETRKAVAGYIDPNKGNNFQGITTEGSYAVSGLSQGVLDQIFDDYDALLEGFGDTTLPNPEDIDEDF